MFGTRVKIVATLGPATNTPERVRDLIKAGADVFRLNFSHGSHDDHARLFAAVRGAAQELGRHVAVLQDLQGPKIRVLGVEKGTRMELVPGQQLVIHGGPVVGEPGAIYTNYPELHEALSPGSRVLLDDGRIEMGVVSVIGDRVVCEVAAGGILTSNKGVNLPGVSINLPTFTEKDRSDLEFGLRLGVDWVALSFVRRGEDVRALREVMERRSVRVPVLAKIERTEALDNLPSILQAFDGVMVARGDLGIELPLEQVPAWQKTIVQQARLAGKASIVATQMLESMIASSTPTRAEVSDVANAVLDGADAVMLSGETSVGAYPVETVAVMTRIIGGAEAVYPSLAPVESGRSGSADAVADAACVLARHLRSRSLVVLTRSGSTAHSVAKRRPMVPIIAFTDRSSVARRLALWWGVTSVVMDFPVHTEEALSRVEGALLQSGMAGSGDEIIAVGSTPLTAHGPANFLKVHRIKRTD